VIQKSPKKRQFFYFTNNWKLAIYDDFTASLTDLKVVSKTLIKEATIN
jgi:hypothetical protein